MRTSSRQSGGPADRKTRYALAGLSQRGIGNFLLPLLGKHESPDAGDLSNTSEVVGIFDIDTARMAHFKQNYGYSGGCYGESEGVQGMLRDCQPDVLLVAGPDHTHCEHIIAGLIHGIDVIVEKPMVLNAAEVSRVLTAERDSSGTVKVAHNLRYQAVFRKLKQLIREGRAGRITNIEFTYNLDTRHGASYFRRWNRRRALSGGLSVHKSVHHIDLINWLIDDVPESVFAFGALNYFGANGAHRPRDEGGKPLDFTHTMERCPYNSEQHAAETKVRAPAYSRLHMPYQKQYPKPLYLYDDEIDIEDTYASVIRYEKGAMLSYSINFSTPWEGFILGINGTGGRLELVQHSLPASDGGVQPPTAQQEVLYYPLFGGREAFACIRKSSGHGGADPLLRNDLFAKPTTESEALGLLADAYSSGLAVAAGEAVWRSAVDGQLYSISHMLGDSYR